MSTWSIPLNRVAAVAKKDVEKVGRKFTFNVFTAVLFRSPVDTGRFRANWNVERDTANSSSSTNIDVARALLQVKNAMSIPLGGIVYMTNGLPYAQRLEYDGWSAQAPQGMIRVSVAEVNLHMRNALR